MVSLEEQRLGNAFEKVFIGSGVSTGPEGVWDLSYAYHNDPFVGSVLAPARRLGGISVNSQEAAPTGVSFKLDGTKMYVIGISGDDVNEYNLSTAWLITSASYSQKFSISSQETAPQDVTFKTDGTKMYVLGYTGKDVNEYSLSTAWDVSTSSYTRNFSVSSQGSYPYGIFFKPDGTKMYVIDLITGKLSEYTLSTGWDISTASLAQQFSYQGHSTQLNQGTAVAFSQDGIFMYILCRSTYQSGVKGVYRFRLSTAWDISTAYLIEVGPTISNTNPLGMFVNPDLSGYYTVGDSTDIVSHYLMSGFSVATQEVQPNGIFFKPEGDKMYITGANGDDVNEYSLGQIAPFSVSPQDNQPHGVVFKPDGTKMYVIGNQNDTVYEYDLSTAWVVSTAVFVQGFSVAGKDNTMLDVFLKPDGTKMYVLGDTSDSVYEYNLSTAWNISTASYVQSFSVNSQNVYNRSVFFKPDGTKMFVVGQASPAEVNEYDLSTAWNISTASFNQLYNISGLGTSPEGLFFKPDGTKMYVAENVGNDINEFNLSTAWDVSTSSFNQLFSVAGQETSPSGVAFDPDGTRMYVVGFIGDDINQYDLSTAWDISTAAVAVNSEQYFDTSTAVFVQNFSISSQDTNPREIFFKPDGTKMYILGGTGQDVNEYNLSTAWDVSTSSYSQNFSISSQTGQPHGLFFRADGAKMFMCGLHRAVSEYNLSTAWDVTSASHSQDFSVSSQDTNPQDLFFKTDGTKMYILGGVGDDVNEYDLSTAWDVTSASFSRLFSAARQTTVPTSIFFKADGDGMFILTGGFDVVHTYTIGPQE